jgi:hypothetical protein
VATIGDARARLALAGIEALKHIGEDVLGEAVNRAPLEEGTLRGSATLGFRVNGYLFDGPGAYDLARTRVRQLARAGQLKTVEAVVSFNTVYAARQHEETAWRHQLAGRAKYLESVIHERTGRYLAAVAANMRRAL